MKTLPNLTGLRFVLAFFVVIAHVPPFCYNRSLPFFNDLTFFNRGPEAVYVFFSLSGFLIIRQLFVEKSLTNSIHLRNFFTKRILRILPLYYLVLTIGFIYYRVVLPYMGYGVTSDYRLIEGILLAYTFFPNIFAVYAPGAIIEVLWSIGIEEQCYLLIAPLVYFIPFKYIKRFLLIFTIIYFSVFFSGSLKFLSNYNMLFFYFTFSGLCSIISMTSLIKFKNLRFLFFGLSILYFTTPVFHENLSKPVFHLFSMVLFGLTLCSLVEKPIKVLENRTMIYLGNISYGVYMYHIIVLQLVGYIFLKTNISLRISNISSIILFNILVFAFTIITAHLSFKYFESYFLKMKKRFVIKAGAKEQQIAGERRGYSIAP